MCEGVEGPTQKRPISDVSCNYNMVFLGVSFGFCCTRDVKIVVKICSRVTLFSLVMLAYTVVILRLEPAYSLSC